MITEHMAILKLADDAPKSLGVSSIVSVASTEGLVEGTDYAINLATSTVRRLRPFGRELLTFVVQYEDHAEERAALEAVLAVADTEAGDAKARILAAIDAALADYAAALERWDVLTAAQQKAVLRRLVETQAQLLRYNRREWL